MLDIRATCADCGFQPEQYSSGCHCGCCSYGPGRSGEWRAQPSAVRQLCRIRCRDSLHAGKWRCCAPAAFHWPDGNTVSAVSCEHVACTGALRAAETYTSCHASASKEATAGRRGRRRTRNAALAQPSRWPACRPNAARAAQFPQWTTRCASAPAGRQQRQLWGHSVQQRQQDAAVARHVSGG